MRASALAAVQVLGVSQVATEGEIKTAFQKASLVHHPDDGGFPAHFELVSPCISTCLICK